MARTSKAIPISRCTYMGRDLHGNLLYKTPPNARGFYTVVRVDEPAEQPRYGTQLRSAVVLPVDPLRERWRAEQRCARIGHADANRLTVLALTAPLLQGREAVTWREQTPEGFRFPRRWQAPAPARRAAA